MKRRRLIAIFTILLTFGCAWAVKPSAAWVVNQAVAKIKNAPSITAHFTASANGQKFNGNLTLSGRCFKLQAGDLTTWFDGTTQWAYSAQAGEVNISTPTPDELAQINPLAIIQNIGNSYSLRQLDSPQGSYRIEMLPKAKSDFKKIILTVNASTYLPSAIAVTAADGTVTDVVISSIAEGGKVASTLFRFNPKSFPGVEVVDLR